MADLLLTHGYFLGEDEKEQQIMRPYPPLGLLSLSAYLARAGHPVEIFDSTLRTRAELTARLARPPAGIVGFYTTLMTRGSVVRLLADAKRHGWTTIVGGPEAATYPEEYLARGADVVVAGEGEVTLVELLAAISASGVHRLHGVHGTSFRDEAGAVVVNAPRALIPDLGALPWPDRAAVDIRGYMDVWRRHHGRGSVTMITARGCAYRCNWCSHAVYGFTHRRRPVGDCADELEAIVAAYRPDQIWYADDVFTIHHGWLHRYAAELKRRNLALPFETISRADRLMKDDVLRTLAEMGCFRIWVGAESGSQRVLDAMERGVTREEIEWVVAAARRHGIAIGLFLMWGYEGETLEDIEATVDLVVRARPDTFLTTLAYPIKGTGYYDKVRDRLTLPRDWGEASDRDFIVAGRADRAYYRHADLWLRHAAAAAAAEPGGDAEAVTRHRAAASAARAAIAGAGTDAP